MTLPTAADLPRPGEPRPGEALRLMAVHAHPDDESSKGAATMARYVSEGVEVLVVTCTGGERGDVLNPQLAHDPAVMADIANVRRAEQSCRAAALGSGRIQSPPRPLGADRDPADRRGPAATR